MLMNQGGTLPLESTFLAILRLEVLERYTLGDTPAGRRQVVPFNGGTLIGPRITATIVAGGADSALLRCDGANQSDARCTAKTEDGEFIHITYRGIRHAPPDVMTRIAAELPVTDGTYYLRNAIFFETASGKYDWLNRIIAVGVGRREPEVVIYEIHEVL